MNCSQRARSPATSAGPSGARASEIPLNTGESLLSRVLGRRLRSSSSTGNGATLTTRCAGSASAPPRTGRSPSEFRASAVTVWLWPRSLKALGTTRAQCDLRRARLHRRDVDVCVRSGIVKSRGEALRGAPHLGRDRAEAHLQQIPRRFGACAVGAGGEQDTGLDGARLQGALLNPECAVTTAPPTSGGAETSD
jgi:hypothetical protein